MEAIGPNHPLRRYFCGVVEQAFCAEVGMCDPSLTDYVAGLLVDFTRMERLSAVRLDTGRKLEQIAAMLAMSAEEKPATPADRDRAVYRTIGDYALFWAGVYPEQLKRARRAEDVLLDYVVQGKRSYAIVSTLVDDDAKPPSRLFRRLSEDFETCLYGLGLVRRELQEGRLSPDSNDLIW